MIKNLMVLVLLILFAGNVCYGQDLEQYELIELPISYFRSNSPYSLDAKARRTRKQINFYGELSDSISVYLNNKLVYSKQINKIKGLASDLTGVVPLKGLSTKKFYFVKVIFHNSKTYCEFPIDPRFYFIDLHYTSQNNCNYPWNAIFSNSIPND